MDWWDDPWKTFGEQDYVLFYIKKKKKNMSKSFKDEITCTHTHTHKDNSRVYFVHINMQWLISGGEKLRVQYFT